MSNQQPSNVTMNLPMLYDDQSSQNIDVNMVTHDALIHHGPCKELQHSGALRRGASTDGWGRLEQGNL